MFWFCKKTVYILKDSKPFEINSWKLIQSNKIIKSKTKFVSHNNSNKCIEHNSII